MNARHLTSWFWIVVAVLCLTVPFLANETAAEKAATQPQGGTEGGTATPNVKTADGLTVITFSVNPGSITVNLPDDIMAGDTISGTVFTEPKGITAEEKAKNQSVLNGIVLDLGGTKIQAERPTFSWQVPVQTTPGRYQLRIHDGLGSPDPGSMTQFGAVITPNPKITPRHPSGAIITPDPKIIPGFIIPTLGQTGRPMVITGAFDGNSANTTFNWTVPRSIAQDSGKPSENVSGGFGLIAESPRKAVFRAPANVIGPMALRLTEGSTQTTGNYRNVGVNLSAPKTSLLRGESTELRIQVTGLEGLTQPVPLTLESKGVITMTGGNYQPLIIQPSQVGADGSYSTTRSITGVQAGGWGATATVVTTRFNVCLQDDAVPHRRLLWNTVTGEYTFTCPGCWPPRGQAGGTPPPVDPNQPPGGLTGQGKPIMKGCIITLQHNAPDRRVFSRLDTCTTSGTSTIEDPKTKVKATITDGNITDNTCQSE